MIQITPSMRILLAVDAVDFRKGIDSLAQVCREVFMTDPFGGAVFVFVNRRRTAIKILMFDGQGFWLSTKRLSTGRFRWWPSGGSVAMRQLQAQQLQLLLWNGNPDAAAPMWRPVAAAQ